MLYSITETFKYIFSSVKLPATVARSPVGQGLGWPSWNITDGVGPGSAESKKRGPRCCLEEVLNGTQRTAGRECDLKYCVHDWLSFLFITYKLQHVNFLNVCGHVLIVKHSLGKAGKDPLVKTDSLSSSFWWNVRWRQGQNNSREQLLVQNFPKWKRNHV